MRARSCVVSPFKFYGARRNVHGTRVLSDALNYSGHEELRVYVSHKWIRYIRSDDKDAQCWGLNYVPGVNGLPMVASPGPVRAALGTMFRRDTITMRFDDKWAQHEILITAI